MATKYLGGFRRGSLLNLGTSVNDMCKTIAQVIANSASNDIINTYPGMYNEIFGSNPRHVIGKGNNTNEIIIDGTLLSNPFFSGYGAGLFENITLQNWQSLNDGGGNFNNNNCIFKEILNFNNVPGASISVGLCCHFKKNLFYNINKSGYNTFYLGNLSNWDKSFNTFYKGYLQYILGNCLNSLKYQIFTDWDLEVDSICSEKYSLFYGNCRIKKTGGSWIPLVSLSDLISANCGNFIGCKVFPNISVSIADNGSGKIRITKIGHGLLTNDFITIRVSSESSYLSPLCQITKIDNDNFDITTINYISDQTIEYNRPLYINEFLGDFNLIHPVYQNCAANMNYENPKINIGWGSYGVPLSLLQLDTLTNLTQNSDNSLQLTNNAIDGTGSSSAVFDMPDNKLYKCLGLYFNTTFEYENGRNITSNSDKSSTIYDPGDTVPAGYYRVEVGDVVISGTTYVQGTPFYKSSSFSFTTSNLGIIREIPADTWPNKFSFKAKIKRGGSLSVNTLTFLQNTPLRANYTGNDISQQPLYGNGDISYNDGTAFDVQFNSLQIIEVKFAVDQCKAY